MASIFSPQERAVLHQGHQLVVSKLDYKPGNSSQYLINMASAGELLGTATKGYRCEGRFKAKYDGLYKDHDVTINVRQMVKDLENVIPDIGEKDIFKEAVICLRHDAGRAAEIMVWSIAIYHLYQFVLKHHLNDFNNSRCPFEIRRSGKSQTFCHRKVRT